MNNNLFKILLFLFLFQSFQAWSFQKQLKTETDLINRFLVYESGRFVAYTNKDNHRQSISFFLNSKDHKTDYLQLNVSGETALFRNNKIINYFKEDSMVYYPVNKLLGIEKEVFITIYNSKLRPEDLNAKLVSKTSNIPRILKPSERSQKVFLNFYMTGLIIILMIIAISRNKFPRLYHDYFFVTRMISFRNVEEYVLQLRPFSRPNILFYIIISLSAGLFIFGLQNFLEATFNPLIQIDPSSFFESIYLWITGSLIILFSIFLKWILIRNLARLFKLREFNYIHLFNSLRFNFLTLIIALVVFTVFYLIIGYDAPSTYQTLLHIVIAMLLLRIILIFFKLLEFGTHRKLHLFSYLCGTELIPFIIVFKLILIDG